jgi:CPA2 family monovalent cation:H+ antiporter-2
VGMMFDYRLLASVWWLVLLVTALTIVARPLCCACGLIAVGHSSANAIKAGIALIPIGEFAFVLIQVAQSSKLLAERFFALGIGVSLVTAVLGPLFTRRSDQIASWIAAREPRALADLIEIYHRWLETLTVRSNANLVWQLTSRRLAQTAFQILFISALILLSLPAHDWLESQLNLSHSVAFDFAYWTLFALVLLGPIIVVWRNLEAIAMIVAEGATRGSPRMESLRPIVQFLLKAFAGMAIAGWLLLLVPLGRAVLWTLGAACVAIILFAPSLWRHLVKLHGRLEVDLRQKMKSASTLGATAGLPAAVLEVPQQWNLQIEELTLPLGSEHAGRRIADLEFRTRFNCNIMMIDRQGTLLANPAATERLFASDKLLILGTREQLSLADPFLRSLRSTPAEELANVTLEAVRFPEGNAESGKSLQDLNWVHRFGVTLCGIDRSGNRIPVPASTEIVQSGDLLLLLGSVEKIKAFADHLGRPESR